LAIEMAAVVRNEMADLDDAEIKLVSGFPSVEFASVTSPLSVHTNWQKFFQEIASRGSSSRDVILSQQPVFANPLANSADFRARPGSGWGGIRSGGGVDPQFESIGKRSRARDEAFSLTVGKAKADYERVVEWTVGPSVVSRRYSGSREEHKDEMWDV